MVPRAGLPLPSNCWVDENPPIPYEQTVRDAPASTWDRDYRAARRHPTFLATDALYCEVTDPPVITREMLLEAFGREPGTQNPRQSLKAKELGCSSWRDCPLSHTVTVAWMGEHVQTPEDLIRPGLRAVCVGINPSPTSVAAGTTTRAVSASGSTNDYVAPGSSRAQRGGRTTWHSRTGSGLPTSSSARPARRRR